MSDMVLSFLHSYVDVLREMVRGQWLIVLLKGPRLKVLRMME